VVDINSSGDQSLGNRDTPRVSQRGVGRGVCAIDVRTGINESLRHFKAPSIRERDPPILRPAVVCQFGFRAGLRRTLEEADVTSVDVCSGCDERPDGLETVRDYGSFERRNALQVCLIYVHSCSNQVVYKSHVPFRRGKNEGGLVRRELQARPDFST
jgi:hypothetical protein